MLTILCICQIATTCSSTNLGHYLLKYLEAQEEALSGDALLCYLRLHNTKNLPADAHQRLSAKLRTVIGISVETDPRKWAKYCLKPLQAVNSPNSPFADILTDALQQNLDYEIDQQCDDGSWTPHWSWFGLYPDEWKIAEREWRGLITLNTVRALHNFGRCEVG